MTSNSYIKKLEVKGDVKTGRQLSVGIPDEFITQYSFKEGEYVIATPSEEGVLLKKVKEAEKVMLDMSPENWPKDSGIVFEPVSLKELDIPYDFDCFFQSEEKKKK